MKFKFIRHGDPEYIRAKMLRWEILSKPLGIPPEMSTPGEEKGIHLLAIDKNQIVGSLLFCPEDATSGRLEQLAVSDTYRGRKFGRKIFAHLERSLQQNGYRELFLEVDQEEALFYQQLGYCPSGSVQRFGHSQLALKKEIC